MALTKITANVIEDGAVTTAKIVDANVTTAKIADGNVTTAKIADANVTPAKLSQVMTLATAQATTSGTSKDFTGIPSWVKRITVMFNGISTNAAGSALPLIQLGDSGGIETTGYSASVAIAIAANTTGASSSTAGFPLVSSMAAATTFSGTLTLCLVDAATNTWVGSLASASTNVAGGYSGGGVKALSGTLDRIRLTTANGTDTFDAGSVNILYEG